MRKFKIKKGFTLIELIVVIAILGILVLFAAPRLLGYTDKAQLTRIQHDTKVMEQEMEQVLIEDETEINSWDNNGKELGVLVMQEKLFEKEGIAKNVKRSYETNSDSSIASLYSSDSSNLGVGGDEYRVNEQLTTYAEDAEENDGDGYKIVPNAYKNEIKTKLKGTFYTNDNGKVYYENDKPLKVDKDVGISCESPEALPDYEFDHATGTITKWNGSEEHLVIPSAFKNVDTGECTTVKIIGPRAFMQGGFKSVVIPDTVKIIGENAFKDNELTEVYIPHSVIEVGNGAFDNNFITSGSGDYGNKNTVFIESNDGESSEGGSGGTDTGSNSGTGGGASFEQNGVGGNSSVIPSYKAPSASDAEVLFNPITGTIVSGHTQKSSKPGLTKETIIIPNEINVGGINYPVKEIAKGAYQGLGLKSVELPSGLERIEDYAFAGNQLVGITTPEKVSYIGNYAFAFNEKIDSEDKTKVATIKNVKMKNGTELEEQFGKLDTYGNIQSGGIKIDKVGIIQLKNFIFVTSIDNHVIDDEYVGTNPIITEDPTLPETSKGIYTDEQIADFKTQGYIEVSSAEDLNGVRNALSGKYIQTKNIDLSEFKANAGWNPIGRSSYQAFSGAYDGGGFKITGLTINNPSLDYQGLFGVTSRAQLNNIGLESVSIVGANQTGGLVGLMLSQSTVSNSYVTGNVEGKLHTGGLVGASRDYNTITNSYTNVNVKGSYAVGGLVGESLYSYIYSSHATGEVLNSGSSTGGLIGRYYSGKISRSYAIGDVVSQGSFVGGLLGSASVSNIVDSYATGSVTGNSNSTGALIGYVSEKGTISNTYAIGKVNTTYYTGGLIASNVKEATLLSRSYFDKTTTGKTMSAGGSGVTGRTTIQMKTKSTYVGWDFDTIWQIEEGVSYPTLR